jgi:acetolactate synthase-1/2/3 large subunit
MAQAFGGFGIKVEHDRDVPSAIVAALQAIDEDQVFALIHLIVEQRVKAY